jgi:hypothetical protein
MAIKPYDKSNTGALEDLPADMWEGTIKLTDSMKTFIEDLESVGINMFVEPAKVAESTGISEESRYTGDSRIQQLQTKGLGKFNEISYIVHIEVNEYGLGGTYHNTVGVKLYRETVQHASFSMTREEHLMAIIADATSGNLQEEKANKEKGVYVKYATPLAKQKASRFLEQALNSGIAMQTQEDYDYLFDLAGLDKMQVIDVENLQPNEVGSIAEAVSNIHNKFGRPGRPVFLLTPNLWSKMSRLESVVDYFRIDNVQIAANLKSRYFEHAGCSFVKMDTLGHGETKDVQMLVLTPGTAFYHFETIEPLIWRPITNANGSTAAALDTYANQILRGEYLSGTYNQSVIFWENMHNPAEPDSLGEHFTRNNYVFGKSGFTQDFNKVIYGTIQGTDKPEIKIAKNRTLASMHDSNMDNSVSEYVNPDNDGDIDLSVVNNPTDPGARPTSSKIVDTVVNSKEEVVNSKEEVVNSKESKNSKKK